MAESQLRIDGLTELREALKHLPADLLSEAGEIVQAHASEAFRQISTATPVHTGNLRDHLRLEMTHDHGGVHAVIRNTAKHAWIVEHGTKPRKWGSGKSTGTMPARPVLVPIAIRQRRVMVAALVDMVERTGLKVTGTGI